MYQIAKWPNRARQVLFRNAAARLGFHEAIVEKDFWVCLMLDYLFHRCAYKDAFTFKGGTSLSKCFGLIKRFSEDIDLILDWQVLGYDRLEPWRERSNSLQNRFNEDTNNKAAQFIAGKLLPALQSDLSEIIGNPAELSIDAIDHQTVCFHYPRIFQTEGILQSIRLEIGALAAWTPASQKNILSYAAECYPDIFGQAKTAVLTTDAERTFWEKVTILHHEANRPVDSPMPHRYSRHYYDIYCMTKAGVHLKAFEQLPLLKKVVDFKMKFYPRKWARYEEAAPGMIKLLPPEHRYKALEDDYRKMAEMMFDEYPDFKTLMKHLSDLENSINQLNRQQ